MTRVPIDLFHNGDLLIYSFMCDNLLTRLEGLTIMQIKEYINRPVAIMKEVHFCAAELACVQQPPRTKLREILNKILSSSCF